MPDWTRPMEGGCRCDRVRLRISAPPVFTVACHCSGCQKMSSSAYSLSMAVPEPAFEVIAGETVLGGLQGEAKHHFCGFCKTWMFSRIPMLAGLVNMRPTMLDDHSWFAPFMETCAADKLPWAETGAVHSYQTFPTEEEVGPLIAEFSAWLEARG